MSTNEVKEPDTMEQHDQNSEEQENLTTNNNETPLENEPVTEAATENDGENSAMNALQQQADDNHNRYLRAQADFDNFRRRTIKEKEEITQAFAKGVDMIYRQLFQVLEAEGLKQMEPVGQPFDPEWHQAIMQVESDEYEEGIVVEVIQSGYMLKDKVIRPAMVKVSQ
jgi:molecular chaperone GrpE